MNAVKRILLLLLLLLGLIGTVASAAAIIGVWSFGARLSETTETVSTEIDRGLVILRDRVGQSRERIESAKIAVGDIEQGLRDWTQREARERLATQLDIAAGTARLESSLEQADTLLELSEMSAGLVQEAMSIGDTPGSPVDTTPVDELIDDIASLRTGVAEATELVAGIHARVDEASGGKPIGEQLEELVQLALRVAATLGALGSRLEEFDEKFPELLQSVAELESRVLRWITGVKIGIAFLFAWMGAGQFALCRLAWAGLRSSRRRSLERDSLMS